MRARQLGGTLIAFILASACQSDQPSDSAESEINFQGGGEAQPRLCDLPFVLGKHSKKPLYEGGSAVLTTQGQTIRLDDGTCRTLRNTEGKVEAYFASFATDLPEGADRAYVEIAREFRGDGTYDARLTWSLSDGDFSSGPATITVEGGGLRGTVQTKDGDATLEFTCGDDSPVDLAPGPALEAPAPGEAVLHWSDGIVYRFENVGCSLDVPGHSLTVLAPQEYTFNDHHYYFRLETRDTAAVGENEGSVAYVYYGDKVGSREAEIELVCAERLSGTFRTQDFEGAFTCPD